MISNSLAELPLEQLLTNPIHHQRIERIARATTKGMNLAWEDAAQTAHFKVLQAAQNGNFYYGGIKEFYHWAAKVAHSAMIDLVRHEYRRTHISLNQPLSGTDLTLLDTVQDPQHSWEVVEHADLVIKVREAIAELDQQYPQRHYCQLWNYRVQGIRQTQIARHLNISQSAVSKRWQELTLRVAQYLGLDEPSAHSSTGKTCADRSEQLLAPEQQRLLRQRSVRSW